jgi:hypothetical protein
VLGIRSGVVLIKRGNAITGPGTLYSKLIFVVKISCVLLQMFQLAIVAPF